MHLKKTQFHNLLYMLKSEVARSLSKDGSPDKTTNPIDLSSINGIGSKIYGKIMQKYTEESRAMTAVRNGAIGLIIKRIE